LAALEEAQFIRFARSNLKKNLRAGNVQVDSLIERPPQYIQTMLLYKLLMATPGVGKVKIKRILRDISVNTTVGDMTQRQRDAVVYRLLRSELL
jgi:hypothetical protein